MICNPLILNAWNEKHWLKPELIEQPELMQVKLVLHIENIEEPKNEPKNLTERQRRILKELEDDGSITREQLSQKLETSLGTIKREISYLRKEGFIGREGGNTYGKWIIKAKD